MRMLIIMASLFLLVGCSIQSSQLSAVMNLINKPYTDVPLNTWSVKYGDYEATVYPVTLPDGTLFSNSAGDQILFDGWTIRSVKGLSLKGQAYQNSDVAKKRTFMRGNRSLDVHQCDQWQIEQQSDKKKFSQSCKGVNLYTNSILVEKDGSISIIEQIVDDRYELLLLTKLN